MQMSKLVFITGAAGGIGRATARRFASAGWQVAVSDVHPQGLEALRKELGKNLAASLVVDVSDAAAVDAALKSIARGNHGRLDLLVNNAGIAHVDSFEQMPLHRHHTLEAVNIRGVLNCTYLAYPYLKAAAGQVVNLCSVSAIYGTPGMAAYSASKYWIRGFTEALNLEWESHGIHVCDVMPALVRTQMTAGVAGKLIESFGVHLAPEDVAREIFDVVRQRREVHRIVAKTLASRMQFRILNLLPPSLKHVAVKYYAVKA
jgi:NAD(P)-dependent dehydrogenase (short-subunit alcohol dehydrogenase family)